MESEAENITQQESVEVSIKKNHGTSPMVLGILALVFTPWNVLLFESLTEDLEGALAWYFTIATIVIFTLLTFLAIYLGYQIIQKANAGIIDKNRIVKAKWGLWMGVASAVLLISGVIVSFASS